MTNRRYLIDITEIQVLSVCFILECMNKVRIGCSESGFCYYLVLLSVFTLEMEAKEDHSGDHACITGEVNTPGNVVTRSIPIKKHLRT
jgi:hypothetical protein